ncbi:MAG TPA: dihydroneopterin aldolase [Bacillota bacterium]|nr:dihydroneopterin aldolase [Bacillota bacterium]
MAVTRLLLKNMVFYGYHGVYAAERELGQKIEIDLELFADFATAGTNDTLEQTINYQKVYTMVKQIVETEHFNLIEAMGVAILNQVLAAYPVNRVTVRVRKPQPPVGGLMDTVEFEVSDNR